MRRFKVTLLAIFLIIISLVYIVIRANTYTYKYDLHDQNASLDMVNIELENPDTIEIIDKKIVDGVLVLEFKAKTQGTSWINVYYNQESIHFFSLYAHKSGVITYANFFGDCNGSQIIPINLIIFLIYLLYVLISYFRKNIKESLYQYKNIFLLGSIIFILFSIISQFFTIIHYRGLIHTIRWIFSSFYYFSSIVLPIAFILSIFVGISNIMLIRKEGFRIKNLLGIIVGVFICLLTISPNIIYNLIDKLQWIDLHNEGGIALYIYDFIESLVYVSATYFECILIGTVVIALKASKKIPEFNKDYIIILGCQIKKDGSLTNLLKSRVDRAIEFAKMQKEKTGKDIIFVPSGGQGNDEVMPEGETMKKYLIENGIKDENIICEKESRNSYENIKFSNKLISEKKKDAKIAFSTTNYHVFRAGAIAYEQSIKAEGIGAKTKTYFWVNAFIREFIATLVSEKKNHILTVLNIAIVMLFMVIMIFMSNMV